MPRPVLCALSLCCILSISLISQQKPTFRSGVEVVLVDVNVVDRSHNPVSDLKPEDFVVSVDYRPRKVVSAQFVRYDVRTSTTTVKETAPAPGAASANAVGRPPARNVLVVIDADSMQPGDGMLVRREAGKFLDKLAPDDRIGVVTIPRVQSVVTMTKNRDEVRAALEKVITGHDRYKSPFYNIGVAEALAIERGESDVAARVIARECRGGPQDCPKVVMGEVRQMQLDAHNRSLQSLEALRDLGNLLRKVEGPKTMLLVSGGTLPPDAKSVAAYSDTASALAAGDVTLYTLYIRQELAAQSKGRPSPSAFEDMDVERDGLANATSAAGGTFMDAVGTIDQYFERVVTELSGSYVLGIEVQASDRDGRPHQVSVKVNRKGLEVRGRKQYVIEPAGKGSRLPGSFTPLSAAAAPVANPARGASATPADLRPLVELAGQYAQAYRDGVIALLSEERSQFRLAKREVRDGRTGWAVANERRLASDTLLVTRRDGIGWDVVRDVFEVDGQAVRPQDGRLRTMFLEGPDTIVERAAATNAASIAHEIGFVNRGAHPATGPLAFVIGDNRDHFVFARQGEAVVAGVPAVQVAFDERGEPAFAGGEAGRVPVSGAFWVDANTGTILKTVVGWVADGTNAEITVVYGKATDAALWVPVEMTETYTTSTERLEVVAKFGNYRAYRRKAEG